MNPDPASPAEELLRRHWGHGSFRPGQLDVIRDVVAGRDVLAVFPTGWGKSVCYQVPALMREGLTLVVSPLVALMADQVAGLAARGISATFLNATLTKAETERRWNDLFAGRHRLLYVAPERLRTETFLARADRLGISLIAVDEAHCVSEWGHDFRPSYLDIARSREEWSGIPILAVTATATPPVRRDVVRLLGLTRPSIRVVGFDRPNLVWSVFSHPDKRGRLRDVLESVRGAGVVYVTSRAGAESWAARLRAEGEAVSVYHAGRPAADRSQAQEDWLAGRTRVMVATSAFGMGIDRPDVRFVAHVDLPPSLESYYQEAGRAGRDGRTAHAVLLWSEGDDEAGRRRLDTEHPSADDLRRVYDIVCSMASIAVGSESGDPFVPDVRRVSDVTGLPLARVRRAVEVLERQDAWRRVAAPDGAGLLRLRGDAGALRAFADRLDARDEQDGPRARLAAVARSLARAVPPEASGEWWSVVPHDLARRSHLEAPDLEIGLQMLEERDLLAWKPPGQAARYRLTGARPARLTVDGAALKAARRRAGSRFDALLRYARSPACRRYTLLAYFGERAPDRCGRCDRCLGRHEPFVALPEHEPVMAGMLREAELGRFPEEAPAAAALPRWKRRALADWLVQQGYLEPDDTGFGPPALTADGRRLQASLVRDDA